MYGVILEGRGTEKEFICGKIILSMLITMIILINTVIKTMPIKVTDTLNISLDARDVI